MRKFLQYGIAVCTAAIASLVVAGPAHAYPTASCDPHGITADDSALADQLNSRLTGTMRGAMTGYRVSCARMIVKTVRDSGWDPRAATIAVTTTIVESTIQNVAEEVDHDSLGLFQQRANWGSEADRLNPTTATNAFLTTMRNRYPDGSWLTAPVGEVCQAVQQSAYPDRYQPQAADGQAIASALWTAAAPPPPDPHGYVYDRSRSVAGTWAAGATRIDANPAIEGIAAAKLPDDTMHVFTVVPGSGLWYRKAWDDNATQIDTNPNMSAVAAAGLPDGTLHVFGVVSGSGVWERVRSASGVWNSNATQIDTNGTITALAAAAMPDGSIHLQVVVPGSGLWDRSRSTAGVWASSATRVDLNDSITAVASAAQPNGTLHIFTAVPGSGIWHRIAWQASATHIDSNPNVTAISAAALPDGTLQLDAAIANSGVWHRTRTAAGVWNSSATQIDTNGRIFSTYTVGLNDNSIHVGTNANIA